MPSNYLDLPTPESSCAHLLQELKFIWDEVGYEDQEREKVLLELERECMDIYKRKVDSANMFRARLHQNLVNAELELTKLLMSLGERSFPGRPEKLMGTLKEQLNTITPALREMQQRKEERMNQFLEIKTQIQMISSEIAGQGKANIALIDEGDLSLKKLEEYQNELQQLHQEKSKRLQKMEEYLTSIHDLASIMGICSKKTVIEVHPSLVQNTEPKIISDTILEKLKTTVQILKDEKQSRLEKICRLGKALTSLWILLDVPEEDKLPFTTLIEFSISSSTTATLRPGSLTVEIIHQAESEVERLNQLKVSKMKNIFLRKKTELQDICSKSHMEMPSEQEMNSIMISTTTGEIDHNDLLKCMEEKISRAKEEASSRKDILDKVEKWMTACEEERWLEEYSRDENRYSVKRGAHINLKRAECARTTINKIPALVGLMMAKLKIWEDERNKTFLYDEVPLLKMLEQYILLRQEKEDHRHKQREKKRAQVQAAAVQDKVLGSRPGKSNRSVPNRNMNMNYSYCNAPSINKK